MNKNKKNKEFLKENASGYQERFNGRRWISTGEKSMIV